MRHFRNTSAVAALAIACCGTAAYAQETTSSIRGAVTTAGAPVAGATVTVTHVPSGTKSTTVTGADGTFLTSGLRVGGPFTVSVVANGQTPVERSGIDLTAGQPLRLDIALDEAAEIVVAGRREAKATELSSGPITVLNRTAIAGVASVSRDIRDIARRSPFATLDPSNSRGVEIAGQNARLNLFSVEGVRFSDNFGLNNGGLPTARGPVPLDAIDQLSVKIAPFDVSEGNFQGGAINVILRSGENAFHGSGFYSYTDDGLTGDKSKDRILTLNLKSKNFGGFLSGPIIKDKLFFAFSYEQLNETTPGLFGLSGFANTIPNLTQAQVDQVSAVAQSRYGYNTLGAYTSNKEKDQKYTAKIDWNITEGQRASFVYIYNKGSVATQANSSSSTTAPTLGLQSDGYNRPEIVHAGVIHLNSDWSDSFSTEARASYRQYDLVPTAYGATTLGQVSVCVDPTALLSTSGTANTNPTSCTASVPRVFFGPDQFRHANSVHTKNYNGDLTARLLMGNHTFKAIAGYNYYQVKNIFVSNALGTYYFDSLADFQTGKAGSLIYGGSISGNIQDTAANYAYTTYNFGIQDSWDVTEKLNVTYGSRVDLYGSKSHPPLNSFFLQRYGFANREFISGDYVYQPRIGATWKATPRLTVRAGTGIFAGGSPDILISNSFSASGVFANSVTIQRTGAGGTGCNVTPATLCDLALNNVSNGTINPAVVAYLQSNTAALSNASVNALSPNYKLARSWKSTLSADYRADWGGFFGDGWAFGGDLLYSKVMEAPQYTDLRAIRVGTMPDGRARYASTSANNDFLLYNTKRGYSLVGVLRIDKKYGRDLSTGISYTWQDVKDVAPNLGTTSSGSYGAQAVVDPNFAAYGTSVYQVRNTVKFNIDYNHAFIGDYKTRFSLFGEWRSGRPYSLTMNDPSLVNSRSIFGTTGTANRYLLYVPNVASIAADPLVSYDSAATFGALQSYIQGNKTLSKAQGSILGKNTQRAPSFFKVDLHVDQEIPVPLWRQARVKLFADMENALNFINKDWGSLRQVDFAGGSLTNLVNVACATTVGTNCTQYRYSAFQNPNLVYQTRYSVWSLRVGAKFEF